ncbi:MAG: DUF2141 domain-containing protein [Bacteroidetes bacterium]|nr:MAG: DUF2141 domain-containing protein [Bacteroidota bacterium]TAG86271.1 MAG: DUF2141 domain-containing protein [Bacteroidota bacterium]
MIFSIYFFIYFWVETHTLTISIQKIPSEKGKMMFAVYDSEKNYMNEKNAIAKKVAKIKNGKATVQFENLKAGKYAFVYFYDKNNDNTLNTNVLGIPTEKYGFSNKASGVFGPPSFQKSSFLINKNIEFLIDL